MYLPIHITTVKHPKQNKWFDKMWNQSSMLPSLTHYCMMFSAFDTPSFDYLAKQLTHLLVKPTE